MRKLTIIPALCILIFLVYAMQYYTSRIERIGIALGMIFVALCTVIIKIQEVGQRKNPFVLK